MELSEDTDEEAFLVAIEKSKGSPQPAELSAKIKKMEAETCINAQMASGVGVPAGKHDEMVSLHVENPERAKSFLSMLPKLDRPPHD